MTAILERDVYGANKRQDERVLTLGAVIAIASCVLSLLVHLIRGVPSRGPNSGWDAGFALFLQGALTYEWSWAAFPIRWLFSGQDGFGSPALHYYGQGAFLPGVALARLGIDAETSLSLVIVAARLLGAIGAFLWIRCYTPWRHAVLGAAIFTLLPYMLLETPLAAFRFAENVATAILPWLFLGLERSRPSFGRVLTLAPLFFLLAITHLQQTLIGAVSLLVWSLVRPCGGIRDAAWTGFAGFVGALLAAPHLMPAILERSWINQRAWAIDRALVHSAMFSRHAYWRILEGREVMLEIIHMVSWMIVLACGALSLWIIRGKREPLARRLSVLTIVMCVMMLPPAIAVWRHIPLAPYIQFSFRWLTVAGAFAGAALAIAVFASDRCRRGIVALVAAMAITVAVPWLDLPASASPAASSWIMPLLPQFRGTWPPELASPTEYVTADAAARGILRRPDRLAIASKLPAVTVKREGHLARFILEVPSASSPLTVPIYPWPTFRCQPECTLGVDETTGLLVLHLPPGRTEAIIEVGRSGAERIGQIGFGMGFGVLVVSMVLFLRRRP